MQTQTRGDAEDDAELPLIDPATERLVTGGAALPASTTLEEVATLVLPLASERLANATGTNFAIDGGLIKPTQERREASLSERRSAAHGVDDVPDCLARLHTDVPVFGEHRVRRGRDDSVNGVGRQRRQVVL
jgi:hypothetical protein